MPKKNQQFDLTPIEEAAGVGSAPSQSFDLTNVQPISGLQTVELPSDGSGERSWPQAALDMWQRTMDKVAEGAQAATDFGVGALKQTGRMVTAPARWIDEATGLLQEAATGDKFTTPTKDFWLDFTEPEGRAQEFGASTAKGLAYVLPGKKERVALNAMTRAIPASARALRSPIRWLGRGAIGGSTAAGVAALNDDDPITAGNTAAVVDMGVQPLLGAAARPFRAAFSPIKRWLERSAGESMSRAIGGPGANTSTKYYMEKFVNPLVRSGRIIWSLPDAISRFRNEAQAALSARDTARQSMPADLTIQGDKILTALDAARNRFRTVAGAGGTKFAGTPEDRAALAELDALATELQKSLLPPGYPQALYDMSPQSLQRQGILPPLLPQTRVLFDTVEDFKQELQNFAKQHGVFSGKQVFGQTPEFTPKVASRAEFSNKLRDLLESEMPPEWAEGNRQFNIRQTIADHLDRAYRTRVLGKEVPLSQTGIGGFGADQTSPTGMIQGMPIRLYRHMTRSPFWNSASAVAKDRLARTLGFQTPRNFTFGNVGAFANREPWEGVEQAPGEDGSVNIRATQVDAIPDEEVGVPEIGTVVGGMIYRGGPIEDPGSWLEVQ